MKGPRYSCPVWTHPSSEPSNGIDLHLTAPAPYFIAANGRLVNQKIKGDKITYHWSSSYPINNYNINFTLGIFYEEGKNFRSIAGNEIPLKVFVLEENREKAPLLLAVLENSLKTQEKYFGEFPFPKDKIAVVETPYLGMEHQTINAYGNNFQFVKMGDVLYDWLLHHELGHEWWGNKLSVADWADFWLHEGLCTYADWLFFLEHGGQKAYLDKVNAVERTLQHTYPVVAPENSTSDEAYHAEIYSKGAFVIHSLRYLLGDELFFPMLKAFVNDEKYTYTSLVETKDFTEFVQQYSGRDLEDFFQLYLYSTKVPKVKINKKGKNGYAISFSNIDFSLPMDILTSEGIQKINISAKPTLVKSDTPVNVDPEGWYLLQ
jgi:aminopeptidase N